MFSKWYFSNDGSFLFAVGCSHFLLVVRNSLWVTRSFFWPYKQIIVTKKTLGTLEVFPKETFTSLMVVLQSSKSLTIKPLSLNLCLDSSRKNMWLLMWVWYKLALIFTWVWYYLLAETFALKVDKSLCPVIYVS